MSDPVSPTTPLPATDADGRLLLSADQARALLRQCCAQFQSGLVEVLAGSLDGTNDLFEQNSFVNDTEILDFRNKRGEWLNRFAQTYKELFEKRLSGNRRRGRRPDADRSLASLRVLNAFDQEKQATLVAAAEMLRSLTRREVDALDLRVGVLLGEKFTRDIDNPFAPDHVLDAMGMTARALLPNPRVWRPLMERLLSDLTPAATKLYIRLNRLLADHHVLPEIKAELRARSDLRPEDDGDLLPVFMQLVKEVAPPDLSLDVVVPGASPPADSSLPMSSALAAVVAAPPAEANPYIAELARAESSAPAAPSASGLPQLDPMLALGSISTVVAALDRWQLRDPGLALGGAVESEAAAAADLPLNRIPWIRSAVAQQVVNPADLITLDVIALLFDYIFRDSSIPHSLRELFARLEVPILKSALLDRSFFSDKKHPARKLLDHLAAAAVGATGDDAYAAALERVATALIDGICREFKVDAAVFSAADARLQAFVEAEQRNAAEIFDRNIAAALAAEQGEAERSEVSALVRDKLTGINVPFEVRGFAETVWCDYLTLVRRRDGAESVPWSDALRVLDELLWSITAKERNAQKARLTKMVPKLIRDLRAGGAAVQVRDDRLQPFLDAVYKLHMAAIKPKPKSPAKPAAPAPAAAKAPEAPEVSDAEAGAPDSTPLGNVHDFVGEMVVGTWVEFDRDQTTVSARLSWVSPLHTKYVFTTRTRGQALVVSPEELAWQLSEGTARLIVEPVALFDRAVSSALDELATQKPAAAA
ncbi:MAG TPA: DUF1631 family protein [Casimicrobiaceae bacterium]|nr:DUF1631 family protein [Casimicrobiaceae bacterium]